MDNFIEIDGTRISLEFVKKPWIRNSYLKFDEDRLVVVSKTNESMRRLIHAHRNWISKHYLQIINTVKLFGSSSIFYNSTKYSVSYVKSDLAPRADIAGSNLILYARSLKSAERHVDKIVREETMRIVSDLAVSKAGLIKKSPPGIKVRKSRKWGVCKGNGIITFNYCISMLPRDLQAYVVSHEVAHLKEMNHSARFWDVVETLCPNYKTLRKEIKNYDNKRREVLLPD